MPPGLSTRSTSTSAMSLRCNSDPRSAPPSASTTTSTAIPDRRQYAWARNSWRARSRLSGSPAQQQDDRQVSGDRIPPQTRLALRVSGEHGRLRTHRRARGSGPRRPGRHSSAHPRRLPAIDRERPGRVLSRRRSRGLPRAGSRYFRISSSQPWRVSLTPLIRSTVVESPGSRTTPHRMAATGSRTGPALPDNGSASSSACGSAVPRPRPMNRARSVSYESGICLVTVRCRPSGTTKASGPWAHVRAACRRWPASHAGFRSRRRAFRTPGGRRRQPPAREQAPRN